jgi:hypothetical protein
MSVRSHMRPANLAASAAFAAFVFATLPANAEEPRINLGPVPAGEPVLTTVGTKRVLAFHEKASGQCIVNAVVFENEESAPPSSRVRLSLRPGQMVHLDVSGTQSVNLKCGEQADTLAVVEPGKFIAASAAN